MKHTDVTQHKNAGIRRIGAAAALAVACTVALPQAAHRDRHDRVIAPYVPANLQVSG
jgi:phage/plasmid primase-like uncharacterized protein